MWRNRNGKKRPMRIASDTTIEWKDPQTGPISSRRMIPAKYQAPVALKNDKILDALVIGHPVMAKFDMKISADRGVYPFASLEKYSSDDGKAPVPKGSLLMYAGPVRTSERKVIAGVQHEVRVIKHTFVTPVGRCIVHDLNALKFI